MKAQMVNRGGFWIPLDEPEYRRFLAGRPKGRGREAAPRLSAQGSAVRRAWSQKSAILRISSSSGRLFLGTFFGGAKKVPRAKRSNPLKVVRTFQARNPMTLEKCGLFF
jgi:hypothetical protein